MSAYKETKWLAIAAIAICLIISASKAVEKYISVLEKQIECTAEMP